MKPVVFITGASAGIGEALLHEYAKRGFSLAAFARRSDRLTALEKQFAEKAVDLLPIEGDVTKEADLKRAAESIQKKYGRLDVVIANAGFGVVGRMEKLSNEDYKRQFETNIFGVLNTVRECLPLLKTSRGRLGIVGSVNGYVTLPGNTPYGMSKFAVRALCRALCFEFSEYGISVTHIAPGFVESEIRRVDNKGRLHEKERHALPSWLPMPTQTAARKIAGAIQARKRERIVTGHGHVAVYLERFVPWLFTCIIKMLKLEARQEA